MKQTVSILHFLILGGLFCSAAQAQGNDASKTIIDKLSQFEANYPAEKAYLQFDKPYYAVGDTIYFKAYVTAGGQHKLSKLSGVLHVELINTKNKIDQSIKLQLDSGLAWGDFALPDSLPAGNYRVRAYTQWMRNFGETGFFEKTIAVGSLSPQKIPESGTNQAAPGPKPDVQFFPEGGSLVAGMRSKVAFKALGANGTGVDVKGSIIDNENREVAQFEPAHLGMGCFYITPEEGKSYHAKISYPDGRQDVTDLPKPEAGGIILSVNNDSIPQASVQISASANYFLQNKGKGYTLVIYSQGTATTVNCKLDSPVIKLCILKRKLHTGVATVTLFSPENEPLAERLLFIQNYDQLSLNVSSDKNSYAKREKVNIKLNALNRKGDPSDGHFSISVTDESKVQEPGGNGDNILTNLLLTSDVKGYIEQPNYYFEDTSATARKNLDILMLTQGYRRFEWKQVLDSAAVPLKFQPENSLTIEGQVKNAFNKPAAGGTVTLLQPNGGLFLSAKTDGQGIFRFPNLLFADTAHMILSAVKANGKNSTQISWLKNPSGDPAIYPTLQQTTAQVSAAAIAGYAVNDKLEHIEVLNYLAAKGVILKQVNIHAKKPDDQYRTQSLAGAGNADQVMHADELEQIEGPLVLSLSGRLHGVTFIGSGTDAVPYLTLNFYSSIAKSAVKKMLVIIDGAYVDPSDINFLNSSDVETVELLKYSSTSIYGMVGAGGVLVITTKQTRQLKAKDIASIGVLPISVMGFYKARQFYAPKYDTQASLNSKQHDLRSTICWNPEIKTDKDGHAGFDFYNADGAGNYKVIVEGIDKDGNIGRQVYFYEVK